jgi:hypothetical protein
MLPARSLAMVEHAEIIQNKKLSNTRQTSSYLFHVSSSKSTIVHYILHIFFFVKSYKSDFIWKAKIKSQDFKRALSIILIYRSREMKLVCQNSNK